jgi:hypothetical protein
MASAISEGNYAKHPSNVLAAALQLPVASHGGGQETAQIGRAVSEW